MWNKKGNGHAIWYIITAIIGIIVLILVFLFVSKGFGGPRDFFANIISGISNFDIGNLFS